MASTKGLLGRCQKKKQGLADMSYQLRLIAVRNESGPREQVGHGLYPSFPLARPHSEARGQKRCDVGLKWGIKVSGQTIGWEAACLGE